MLSLDARLTLIALVPLPFVSIAVRYFGTASIAARSHPGPARGPQRRGAGGALGVRVVRAYCQEGHEERRFREANLEYVARSRASSSCKGSSTEPDVLPRPRLPPRVGLGSRAVIRRTHDGGEFVAFNAYLTMLSWPMIAFGWVTNMLQRAWLVEAHARGARRRAGHHRCGRRPDLGRGRFEGALAVRDLVFAYEGRRPPSSTGCRSRSGPARRWRLSGRPVG